MFLMTCFSLLFPLLLILLVLSPWLSSPMSVLTCCVINGVDVLSLICTVGPTQISHRIILSHFFPRTNCPLFCFVLFCFFVTPFYLFFPYHFSITFLLTFRIFDFFPDQGPSLLDLTYYNLSQVQLWQTVRFWNKSQAEVSVYNDLCLLFLRSLCSLLPTHFNFSWSCRFIQKCLKIARGCFFLPLFANPRIVLNVIHDLYPVVLNCFLSFILYHGCHQCFITQVNRVLKTLPVLPVYNAYAYLLQYATPLVTQELFIFAQLVAHAPDAHQGPFALFDANRLRILTTA